MKPSPRPQLLRDVIRSVIRHKYIFLVTVSISLIFAAIDHGLSDILLSNPNFLPITDDMSYPQYIGTYLAIYTLSDFGSAFHLIGYQLLPLVFIYKAEHPDAAPIGIHLLSESKQILLLFLLALLTTCPKHLINCGYDALLQLFSDNLPPILSLLAGILMLAAEVSAFALLIWIIPKKAAVTASSQSYALLQQPPLKQLIFALVLMYIVFTLPAKLLQDVPFPYSMLNAALSAVANVLQALIFYRAFLPTETD